MDAVNRQVRLAARPVGLPKDSDWEHTEEPVAEPGEGEVLVKVRYLSLDPAMRGWMNDARSYLPPVGIGEVMRAGGCGEVIASQHPDFAPGDHVTGVTGVQEYAVLSGDAVTKVDPELAPLPVYLGTLGMPGMTAYFGLLDIGKTQAGRDGGRLRRRRRGRQRRRPDRQDQGLPRRRHRRRRGEVPPRRRGARLRRLHRLQVRERRQGAAPALPRRHRRLLRQRRRRDPRRCPGPAGAATPASSSAARSRSTTRPTGCAAPPTTCRCSSTARA